MGICRPRGTHTGLLRLLAHSGLRVSVASLYCVEPSFLGGARALGVLPFSTQILGPRGYGTNNADINLKP